MDMPRYARLEMERRWLVDPARCPDVAGQPHRRIEDLYLEGRLRLRKITHSATGAREFKLGRKYEREDPLGGPITTLYLSEAEYVALAGLPGARLSKRRYVVDGYSLDIFEGPLAGLVMAEAEREDRSAVLALATPAWAAREVSTEPFFTGGQLCRATPAQLRQALARGA